MRERGILMSAPMVRALLAGTKTQTRRVVKWTAGWSGSYEHLRPTAAEIINHKGHAAAGLPCPYGVPGDRLWVRETFSGPNCMDATVDCAAAPPSKWGESSRIWYWADGNPPDGDWSKPRPSIFMPRWASRLTLEITEVRVERPQEISEADSMAEGIGRYDNGTFGLNDPGACMGTTAVVAYMRLWESINGRGSWDLNPYVWAITFRRIGDA